MTGLVLGPLLRYVDADSAAVWVETAGAAEVTVTAGDRTGTARTFAAHGHHYALVDVTGLEPGTRTPYRVHLDGVQVWPEADSAYPGPVIPTLEPGRPLRLAFGSCRVSAPHDEEATEEFGVDALRAFAVHLATAGSEGWPDLVLFLGDQVYADETSDQMREFIASRRSLDEAPGEEIKNYVEYAHLYALAWSEPANRWLLSTLPSAMIFDDHDVRDDWNTSWTWRRQMEATEWWHERIVGGLGSYWVYQHLGNLDRDERAKDPLWRRVVQHEGEEELDLSAELDALADRADQQPGSYRWSFTRDFDTQARLVVVDSRAARVLEPHRRSIIDDAEMDWLDDQLRGGFDHLLVGTSLPFLMAPGLHHAESFSEALCNGVWGERVAHLGEKLRQAIDLEHWGAFQQGFQRVARIVLDVACGDRGEAPQSITFLSGDVHHSYVSTAGANEDVTDLRTRSRIVQAVCSPIRNPLPAAMQRVTTWGVRPRLGRAVRRLARLGKVPPPPLTWRIDRGPWYDNNLAVLEVQPDGGLLMTWYAGDVEGRGTDEPLLRTVAEVGVEPPIGG